MQSKRWGRTMSMRRRRAVLLLLFIGLTSVALRWLLNSPISGSGVLYIGVPFAVALALLTFLPPHTQTRWWHGYRNFVGYSLVIMLGSSIVLYEGFICVLFFLPLYLLIVSLVFVTHWAQRSAASRRSKMSICAFPALLLAGSLEGIAPELSFPREHQITVQMQSSLSVAQLHENLTQPIDLNVERGWLLGIFPMPYEVITGPVTTGAVHRAKTDYARWFFANHRKGEIALRFDAVEQHYLRTRVIKDTSHFSGYVTVHGTEILFTPTPMGTDIELTIHYVRILDPAWYFHPLTHYALQRMGALLIEEVLLRG